MNLAKNYAVLFFKKLYLLEIVLSFLMSGFVYPQSSSIRQVQNQNSRVIKKVGRFNIQRKSIRNRVEPNYKTQKNSAFSAKEEQLRKNFKKRRSDRTKSERSHFGKSANQQTVQSIVKKNSSNIQSIANANGIDVNWFNIDGGSTLTKGTIYTITSDNTGNFYIGGDFQLLGDGRKAGGIAIWNSNTGTWSVLDDGTNNGVEGEIYSIVVDGTDIYVGGDFTTLSDGITSAREVAKWNGTNWVALDDGSSNGFFDPVYSMAQLNNHLYVGGYFWQLSDGTSVPSIAEWDKNTNTWKQLSDPISGILGFNDEVDVVEVANNMLYCGGYFDEFDNGTTANYIAQWDPATNTWSVLNDGLNGISGVNDVVWGITVFGNNVYVGGSFDMFDDGSTTANNIAVFNTAATTWSVLDDGSNDGLNGSVYTISTDGNFLYVGGSFTELSDGSTTANYVAAWDLNLTQWSPLIDGGINGLDDISNWSVVYNGSVYYTGEFEYLGDGSTKSFGLARWDGTNWHAILDMLPYPVAFVGDIYCVAQDGNDVYFGGEFDGLSNNGMEVGNIVKWNSLTNTFSPLNDGTNYGTEYNSYVNAIAVDENNIYISGSFDFLSGGTPAANIAAWNKTNNTWNVLDDGTNIGFNDEVNSLCKIGNTLYAAGYFDKLSGGTNVKYIAKWESGNWLPLNDGVNLGLDFWAFALTSDGSNLYIGGWFNRLSGGADAGSVCMWNGNAFFALNDGTLNGVNSFVFALNISNSNLYVGGSFSKMSDNTTPAVNAAVYNLNTNQWSPLNDGTNQGVDGHVNAIASQGNKIFFGGYFYHLSGGTASHNIAMWDGSQWNAFNAVPDDGEIWGFSSIQNTGQVYVASGYNYYYDYFSMVNGISVYNAAKFNIMNSPPVLSSIELSSADFKEGNSSVVLTNSLIVSDADNTNLQNAIVTITGNFQLSQDELILPVQNNGISGLFLSATGVLTLTGNASLAAYQNAIRSIRYINNSSRPVSLPRTVSITVYDGVATSNTVTRSINIYSVNTAPVISDLETDALNCKLKQHKYYISQTVAVEDADDAMAGSAVINITGNYQKSQDVLIFENTPVIKGVWELTSGSLYLSGAGSVYDYQNAIRKVMYYNSSLTPSAGERTIRIIFNDGQANSNTAERNIKLPSSDNIPPLISNVEKTILNFGMNEEQKHVTDSVKVSDPDNENLLGAEVKFASGFVSGEDILDFTPTDLISGKFDWSTGILFLAGEAPVYNYEDLFKSIIYKNYNGNNKTKSLKTLTFTVWDGLVNSNIAGRRIDVDGVVVDVSENGIRLPDEYQLYANYPNPFNPSTRIRFDLPFESSVNVSIYNILGERIKDLVTSTLAVGTYEMNWDASTFASGMYILSINAKSIDGQNKFVNIRKMLLLK